MAFSLKWWTDKRDGLEKDLSSAKKILADTKTEVKSADAQYKAHPTIANKRAQMRAHSDMDGAKANVQNITAKIKEHDRKVQVAQAPTPSPVQSITYTSIVPTRSASSHRMLAVITIIMIFLLALGAIAILWNNAQDISTVQTQGEHADSVLQGQIDVVSVRVSDLEEAAVLIGPCPQGWEQMSQEELKNSTVNGGCIVPDTS